MIFPGLAGIGCKKYTEQSINKGTGETKVSLLYGPTAYTWKRGRSWCGLKCPFFWRRLEGAWVAWILRPGFMVVSATLTVVSSRENSVPDPDYLIAAYGKSRRTELDIFGFYKQQ